MIDKIISSNFQPMPQQGDPVYFRRREPEQSELPYTFSNTQLYDHIRMTDAEGYPLAYLDWGEWRISFFRGWGKLGWEYCSQGNF